MLRRRLVGSRRHQQPGAPDPVGVELLDHDPVEQGTKLVAHKSSASDHRVGPMRLIVARCEVRYSGRLDRAAARGAAADHRQGRRIGARARRRRWLQAAQLDDAADRDRGVDRSRDRRAQARRQERGPARDRRRADDLRRHARHGLPRRGRRPQQGRRRGAPAGAAGRAAATGAARASGWCGASGRPTSDRST